MSEPDGPRDEYGFKKPESEWSAEERRRYEEQQRREQEQQRQEQADKERILNEKAKITGPILERFASRQNGTVTDIGPALVQKTLISGLAYTWRMSGGVEAEAIQDENYILIVCSTGTNWSELGDVLRQNTGLRVEFRAR